MEFQSEVKGVILSWCILKIIRSFDDLVMSLIGQRLVLDEWRDYSVLFRCCYFNISQKPHTPFSTRVEIIIGGSQIDPLAGEVIPLSRWNS